MKIPFFRATIEIIIMYGSETWTVTKNMSERIDCCYTIILLIWLSTSIIVGVDLTTEQSTAAYKIDYKEQGKEDETGRTHFQACGSNCHDNMVPLTLSERAWSSSTHFH